MKIDNIPDKSMQFKRYFVKLVENYLQDPTDRKQAKLKVVVNDATVVDPSLVMWFNAMFKWRNTKSGLHVDFRNDITDLFSK
jgi:hypothetical protein